MKTRIVFVLFFMMFIIYTISGSNGELTRKPAELNDDQVKIFEKIKKIYPDIPCSKNVILFNDDEHGVTVYVEIVFEKDKKGYIGKYKEFCISFVPSDIEKSIKYKAELDNGITKEGLIFIGEQNIVRVENECKQKKCITKVFKNSKLVYPKK